MRWMARGRSEVGPRESVEQEKRSVFLDVAEFGTNFAWAREKRSVFLYNARQSRRDVEELGTSFSVPPSYARVRGSRSRLPDLPSAARIPSHQETMWNFLQRRRLIGKGMACAKTRRTLDGRPWARELARGWMVRSVVLLLFILGLAGLVFTGQQAEPAKKFLLCVLILLTALAQLWVNHPDTLKRNARLTLVLGVLLAQLGAIKLILAQAASGAIDLQLTPVLVPYAFAPLTLSFWLSRSSRVLWRFSSPSKYAGGTASCGLEFMWGASLGCWRRPSAKLARLFGKRRI